MKTTLEFVADMVTKLDMGQDEIKEALQEQQVVQVKQQMILEDHVRRSLALERSVANQEKFMNRSLGAVAAIGFLFTLAEIWSKFKGG